MLACFGSKATLATMALLAIVSPGAVTAGDCFGDCDDDDRVAVHEIVRLVNVALGTADLDVCPGLPRSEVPRIDDLIRAVRHLLDGCPSASATPTPTTTSEPTSAAPTPTPLPTVVVDDDTLTAGRVLRIEFVTTPPFVESLPNTLYALLGTGDRQSPFTTMTGALFDGDALLGVSTSAQGCCATGSYSFNPAPVTWRSPGSPWNFPTGDPATADFTTLHDGTIDGRMDISIDAGSIVLDLDAVALVFIHATFANGGSTIPPAPVLRSVRILGPSGNRTPTAAPTVSASPTRTSGATPTLGDDDD